MQAYKGTVQKGERRGTALGFPTANISLDDPSVSGIYSALVTFDGKRHHAAAFADQHRGLLEAHVLDFSGDLYDREIIIELLEKIRESQKFENDADLRAMIASDIEKIRAYLKKV